MQLDQPGTLCQHCVLAGAILLCPASVQGLSAQETHDILLDPARRFVAYCMKRVELLQRAGVTPIIIFDGGRLPMKAEEEAARARRVQCLLSLCCASASAHEPGIERQLRDIWANRSSKAAMPGRREAVACAVPPQGPTGQLTQRTSASFGLHRGRQENLEKARAHWAAGNTAAAYECYQRAVDISPATAKRFIDARAPAFNTPFLHACQGLRLCSHADMLIAPLQKRHVQFLLHLLFMLPWEGGGYRAAWCGKALWDNVRAYFGVWGARRR